jgi:hypothetical protein
MTAILAIQHPDTGAIAIGADGRAHGAGSIISDTTRKLVSCGAGVIVGTTGSYRINTLLQRDAPTPEALDSPVGFCEWLRGLVIADGWEPEKEARMPPAYFDGMVIAWGIGNERGVYDLDGKFGLSRMAPGWPAARGSSDVAAAALLGLTDGGTLRGWEPAATVRRAIEIAGMIEVTVGGKIEVLSL